MSKLEELIQKLCPKGVEYKLLNNVVKSISTGLNPRKNFTLNIEGATNFYVTVKEITTGKIVFSDKTDKITDEALDIIQDRSNLEFGDVLLSGIGTIGKVALVDIPIGNWNCSESVFLIKPKNDVITSAFLAHILGSKNVQKFFQGKARGSTLKGIRQQDLKQLKIPVPPIEVQEEIVRILDKFTELSAELTAELTARKKQYEFYRDKLILEQENVEYKTLGEIATEMYRGSGIKRDELTPEGISCVRYGEIYTTYDVWFDKCVSHTNEQAITSKKYFENGDILFAITGESVEEIAKSCAYTGNNKCLAGGDIVVMKHKQNPKYLAYALYTTDAQRQKSYGKIKSKVVHASVPSIKLISIPLPPLAVQEKIASILDNFHSLVTDISEGLPAEIEARQKQYEYYRDKLLTFEEIAQ